MLPYPQALSPRLAKRAVTAPVGNIAAGVPFDGSYFLHAATYDPPLSPDAHTVLAWVWTTRAYSGPGDNRQTLLTTAKLNWYEPTSTLSLVEFFDFSGTYGFVQWAYENAAYYVPVAPRPVGQWAHIAFVKARRVACRRRCYSI